MHRCRFANAVFSSQGLKSTYRLTIISIHVVRDAVLSDDPSWWSAHQLGPRYEEQLMSDGGAYSPFRVSSSYSLTTLSSYVSTDRRAVTDMNGKTQTLRCAPFLCCLRQRECCMLGAPSSQPTVPLHKLPPARLVIHRQTSAHERRKWTGSVQSRSGILAYLCTRQHWLWITVELHITGARHGEAVAREGGRYAHVR